jgi:hypothetical protein
MELTKNLPKPKAGSVVQKDSQSFKATAQQSGFFVQIDEECMESETAIHPMTLKKKTD